MVWVFHSMVPWYWNGAHIPLQNGYLQGTLNQGIDVPHRYPNMGDWSAKITSNKVVKKVLNAQTIPQKKKNHPFKLMCRWQLLYLHNLAQVLFGAITVVDMMLYYDSICYMAIRLSEMVWVFCKFPVNMAELFSALLFTSTVSLPTLEDIWDGWQRQLHAQAPQNFAWGTFVSLHQLLYDVFLTELVVRVSKFLCDLHPTANVQFNPMPLQSFLMSSGTDQFSSINEWVQCDGQLVQQRCQECGSHLKQKTEWRVVPEILSFKIALSAQRIIDPKFLLL